MTKEIDQLQPTDVFRHLNGKLFQVVSTKYVGGDNYKVTCLDQDNNEAVFTADFHTQFEIVMTYSKVGA